MIVFLIFMVLAQSIVFIIALNKALERRSAMWLIMAAAFFLMILRRITAVELILWPGKTVFFDFISDNLVLPLLITILFAIALTLFAKKDTKDEAIRVEAEAELQAMKDLLSEEQRDLVAKAKERRRSMTEDDDSNVSQAEGN